MVAYGISGVRRFDSAVGKVTMVKQTRCHSLTCPESVEGTVTNSLRLSTRSSQPLSPESPVLTRRAALEWPGPHPLSGLRRKHWKDCHRDPKPNITSQTIAARVQIDRRNVELRARKRLAVQVRRRFDPGSTPVGAGFAEALVAAGTESVNQFSLMYRER